MDGKRRHEEVGDSSSHSGSKPELGGAQKLLAKKKQRRATSNNDMVTAGVGRSSSGRVSTPTMARLQPPPVTPSPAKVGVVGYSHALGIHTGDRRSAMTLLSTPSEVNTPSLSRGYWAAFKSGLTPSLDPTSTGLAPLEDPDALPSSGVLPTTLPNAAFTFASGIQSGSATENDLEDADLHGASDEDEDEDEDEQLTWWQIAGRAIDTVYTNIGWYLGYRELYLLEDLRLDAPPQYEKCVECVYFKGIAWDDAPAPEFRCEDCRGGEWCRDCVRHVHRYTPFHRIEKLVGGFWQRVRDKTTLGIEVQLMHAAGDKCKVYDYARVDNFAVIHENGIHGTRVQFCKCARGRSVERWAQLMRYRLWPATSRDPKTATTYEALDMFTRLSMLGRLSGYDLHRAIEAATDGARVFGLSSLRKQFMRCARQFGHILLFKRAGRGHEDGGIAGTPHGGCAIICPACPREGYNIPDDWRSRLFPWSYRVILSTDANFRLSNRLTRSTESTDPCFNDGRAYMVPMKQYNAYIDSVDVGKDDAIEERADCSRFKAQGQANLKGGKGLRTTGVAGVFCARHEFWQPLGLAPLKKGERYSTIDFISTMVHSFLRVPVVVHSYDIACQWHKNLQKRLNAVEEGKHGSVYAGARTMLQRVLLFIVPKFHIFAHVWDCFLRYNPSHTRGVGQTDGEACERVWASMNGAATSLREMGPGAMRDALDLMCSFWNWMKACTMRTRGYKLRLVPVPL